MQATVSRLLADVFAHAHELGAWSYAILAVAVMIEGPFATLIGAGAAAVGVLKPQFVFVSAALGNLTGDLLWYSLGRLGRTSWLSTHGRWLGLSPEMVEVMRDRMRQDIRVIIFVAKLTLFLMIPTLLATGVIRARLRRWFPVDIAAECLWTGFLVVAGYNLSGYLLRLNKDVQVFAGIGSFVAVFVALTLVKALGKRWGERQSSAARRAGPQPTLQPLERPCE